MLSRDFLRSLSLSIAVLTLSSSRLAFGSCMAPVACDGTGSFTTTMDCQYKAARQICSDLSSSQPGCGATMMCINSPGSATPVCSFICYSESVSCNPGPLEACTAVASSSRTGSPGGISGGSPSIGQSCQKGSIIRPDTQNVGESVAIVGTPFSLVYFTDRVIGRKADYSIRVPLEETQGMNVRFNYLGRSETPPVVSGPNAYYDFVWDGKDANGVDQPGGAVISVSVWREQLSGGVQCKVESNGTQICFYSEAPSISPSADFDLSFDRVIGGYKAVSAGLGGWTLSIHHFYDPAKKMLYLGDGNSHLIAAQSVAGTSHLRAASESGSEVYIFDQEGRHLETRNGLTGAILYSFFYDAAGRLQSVVDAYSNSSAVERDAFGNLIGIRAPFGQLTELTLGPDGYLSSIRNPKGEAHAMTYHPGGLMASFTKPKGQVSSFYYDNNGLLIQDASSSGASVSFATSSEDITAGTRSIQMASALGRTTSFSLLQDQAGFTRTETDPQGVQAISQLSYDSQRSFQRGDVSVSESFEADPRLGNLARYIKSRSVNLGGIVLDQQVLKMVTPAPPASEFEFDSLSTSITTNGSKMTNVIYTPATSTTEITTPAGRKITLTSDPQGKLKSSKLDTLSPVKYVYEEKGRLSRVIQGARSTEIFYDANGHVRSIRDPMDQVTRFTYDLAGRVKSQTLPDSKVIAYTWDANGNLASITPPEKPTHKFTWNVFDLMRSYLPPSLGGDPSLSTGYFYNKDEQLTRVDRPDGSSVSLLYNRATGKLETIRSPSGDFNFSYLEGKLRSSTSHDGVTNTYSFSGPLLLEDSLSNAGSGSFGSMRFGYNNEFKRVSSTAYATDGFTSISVNFLFDEDGLLLQSGNQKYRRSARTGLVARAILGRITEDYVHDSTYGELASVSSQHTSAEGVITPLLGQALVRDALGRIIQKTETVGGISSQFNYTFDSQGRLTDVLRDGAPYSHYEYDANGNRISGNAQGSLIQATYDEQDRLSSYNLLTFSYNSKGELSSKTDWASGQTTTYAFDALGTLKQVSLPTKTISYRVDGQGRRQARLVDGIVQAQYLYEDGLRIGAVLTANGAITHRFIYGSKSNVPDAAIISGKQYRILSDPNGSVRLVVLSSTGAIAQKLDYDEFGNVLFDSNPGFQPFGFAGGLVDPDTKLVHFGAREYEPQVGRWISKDPIGFNGGDTNLYGYVLNDPINLADPSGLIPLFAVIGGFLWPNIANAPGPDDAPIPSADISAPLTGAAAGVAAEAGAASAGLGFLGPGGGGRIIGVRFGDKPPFRVDYGPIDWTQRPTLHYHTPFSPKTHNPIDPFVLPNSCPR